MLEEHRIHYNQRVDEIAPSIRYCAYNIGDMPSDVKELTKLRVSMPGYELLASKIDVRDVPIKWPFVCQGCLCRAGSLELMSSQYLSTFFPFFLPQPVFIHAVSSPSLLSW